MAGYIGSKAVLLSTTAATVTGDMTVDTSTLKVDSGNNRVGIGTASPHTTTEIVTTASGSVSESLQIRNNATASGTGSKIRMINSTDANSDANSVSITSNRTNGDNFMTFETEDTERMRIDADGHVTMPNQSAFLVAKSASQDFDRNVDTTITFDTEVFDNNADFSSNTFTAPVTGKYQFNAHVRIDLVDNGAEYYLLYIRTSNRDHYKLLATDDFSSDPAFWTWSSSFLTDMDASDTAYLQIKQYGGSPNHSHVEGSATWTNFSGYLVC